jgi:ABC-type multidrug transport system fused ATPase/permease subunit
MNTNSEKKQLYILNKKKYNLIDALIIPFIISPFHITLVVLYNIFTALIPTVYIVAVGGFIDKAIEIVKEGSDKKLLFPSLIFLMVLIAVPWLIDRLMSFVQARIYFNMTEQFKAVIIKKRANIEYRHIENPNTLNLIDRITRNTDSQILTVFYMAFNIINLAIRIAGLMILLFSHQAYFVAVIIIASSVPMFLMGLKSGKENYDADKESSKYIRKFGYYSKVITGRDSVDERTLFNYGKNLSDKWYDLHYTAAIKIVFKKEFKWTLRMRLGSIMTTCVSIAAMFLLLNQVLTLKITIGTYISLVNGIFVLVNAMSVQFSSMMTQIAKSIEFLHDFSTFASLEQTPGALDLPDEKLIILETLEFCNVSFKYPETENYILKNLSFKIEKGYNYAFVGVNGAGKTTITKLITGLYNNYDGDIYVNDRNLREFSQGELKSLCSVINQDFAKYQITMKENIAIGNINLFNKNSSQLDENIKEALKLLSLENTVEKLPNGIDTPLGKIKKKEWIFPAVSGSVWRWHEIS